VPKARPRLTLQGSSRKARRGWRRFGIGVYVCNGINLASAAGATTTTIR
jgi:hypothetical protein